MRPSPFLGCFITGGLTQTVLRIRDVYPGSEFFNPGAQIPDPGSKRVRIRIKEVKKMFLIRIRILIFFIHPGSRGQKGTGSRRRIRNTALKCMLCTLNQVQKEMSKYYYELSSTRPSRRNLNRGGRMGVRTWWHSSFLGGRFASVIY